MRDLTRPRALAVEVMTTEVTVVRPDSEQTIDDTTLQLVAGSGSSTAIYTGGCLLLPENDGRYWLHVPWDTDPLDVGDQATITDAADPELVGRIFRVERVELTSILIWRRALVAPHAHV